MNVRNFALVEGSLPILLSAPHTFHHLRPSLRGVLKQGEENTDKLVMTVASESGAYGIYLTDSSTDYDPNYQHLERNLYKQEIANLAKNKKISTVFDIHGLSDHHNFDFGIYYCMRFRRSKDLAMKLLEELGKERELKELSYKIGYMAQNHQETITEFVCEKLKFPAIQLEIARYIRRDEKLFNAICRAMVRLISKL